MELLYDRVPLVLPAAPGGLKPCKPGVDRLEGSAGGAEDEQQHAYLTQNGGSAGNMPHIVLSKHHH